MTNDLATNCVSSFRKYANTVAVSAGISHLFETSPSLGRFIGVEHKLMANPSGLLTPDITALYDNDSKGLLFDLKYSLPADVQSVKDELLELEKYKHPRGGWGTSGVIQAVDFVLVCHMDDAHRATEAIRQLYQETSKSFFSSDTFSIWSWTITVARDDPGKEEMRLLHMYGTTRNATLQAAIAKAGGILVHEEVLTALRFTQNFVREKPPVQYTMCLLIQNVFSALPPLSLSLGSQRQEYAVTLDTVSQKANVLFPPWWETDVQTVQVKRSWVKEALDELVKIGLVGNVAGKPDSYSISIRRPISRKQLPQVICEKLSFLARRRPRGRPPSSKRIAKDKVLVSKPLEDYFS